MPHLALPTSSAATDPAIDRQSQSFLVRKNRGSSRLRSLLRTKSLEILAGVLSQPTAGASGMTGFEQIINHDIRQLAHSFLRH